MVPPARARFPSLRARRRRTVFTVAAVAAVVWFAVTGPVFVWSHDGDMPVARADAVVVFAGGRGERLAEARSLIDDGVASVLVISNGRIPTWPEANELCDAPPSGLTVICPTPEPDDTGGEASMVQDLAADRGWRKVVIVTSNFHAPRSALWAGRCAGDAYEVEVRGVRSRYNEVQVWGLALREQVAMAAALTLERSCPGH